MKKGLLIVAYFVALVITLIYCLMWFGIYGMFVYFVLGILYVLPFKLYEKHKEKKNKEFKDYIKSLNIDVWESITDYAM